MIYLILYSILIILCLWDIIKPFSPKQSNVVLWGVLIVFTLFRGLRWCTGTDWDQFYIDYGLANFSNIFSFSRYAGTSEVLEPGYVFSNAVFNIFVPYTGYLLAFNFVLLLLLKKSVTKLLRNYRVFCFCFLLITAAFFPNRQEMANAIMIFSLTFFLEKNWKKFCIAAIIAFSIHKSALVMVMLFLLFNLKTYVASPILIGVFLSSYVIDLPFIRVFIDKVRPFFIMINSNYEHSIDIYSNIISDGAKFNLSSFILNIVMIVIFCHFRDKCGKDKANPRINFLLNVFVFYLFGLRLFQNIGMTYFVRIMKYFYFADAFLFAHLFANLFIDQQRKKKILKVLFISFVLFLTINRFLASCHVWTGCNFPYHSVLEGINNIPRNIADTFEVKMLFK